MANLHGLYYSEIRRSIKINVTFIFRLDIQLICPEILDNLHYQASKLPTPKYRRFEHIYSLAIDVSPLLTPIPEIENKKSMY